MISEDKSIEGYIPFSLPYAAQKSFQYISDALTGLVQQGDGHFSIKVQERIQDFYPDSVALLTPSCTGALELSMMILDLGPGDEVIVPSFTFTSAATAVTKFWATPVFCDIDPQTGCIDTNALKDLITPQTKAISWVNYGGLVPNLAELKSIAGEYELPLIEDSAHSFGIPSDFHNKTVGDFVTFSFHATKNFQCGEGGALLMKKEEYLERAHVMREKGTNRNQFSKGKVSKYSWVERGGSYLLAEVNSALLFAQLEEFDSIQARRSELVRKYENKIGQRLPEGWRFLNGLEKASHLFAILAPSREARDNFINSLKSKNIIAVSHYEDLSNSVAGIRYGRTPNECTNSKQFSDKLVRLPLYYELSDNFQNRIIDEIECYFTNL